LVEAGFFAQVHDLVRQVPTGRIVTYGQVARALGHPRQARLVGWAVRACPADVPWHRVVNARGMVSIGDLVRGFNAQRALLEAEGVSFDSQGRIDLRVYAWRY